MRLRYLYLTEGTSDLGLRPILETLVVGAGVDEVQDVTPDLSLVSPPPAKTLSERLRVALRLAPEAEFIFLHRDANGAGREARLKEMDLAMREAGAGRPWVPVLPQRMLEAWLLLDEAAIREVAGNPRGHAPLELPAARAVERCADAKELLQEALAVASEHQGRRLQRFRSDFPRQRARLLERLDPDGPVAQLTSWRYLVEDIQRAVAEARAALRT